MISQLIAILSLFSAFLTSNAVPQYAPTCAFPRGATADSGYELWSSPATWRGMFPSVPGLPPLTAAVVTIPCGKKVILDVKNIVLRTLDIQGALKVLDTPGQYNVSADRVIVQGQFKIGNSPKDPFKSKIMFTLTNKDRQTYSITRPTVQTAGGYKVTGPQPLGLKVFAVVGGRVLFYGMLASVPSWVLLGQSAMPGANFLIVKGMVGRWPVGSLIALTTTYRLDVTGVQNEYAMIKGVRPMGGGRYQIVLDRQLRYEHTCVRLNVPGSSKFADQCGAVALLSRNIVIRGSPDTFIGGHFSVAFTPTVQWIQGVEFVDMGQQGLLARYPLHFHMGITGAGTMVTKNAVHHSKQRCYVIHGTNDLQFVDNVCFQASGIGFAIEDGIEMRTVIDHNLISGMTAPTRLINVAHEEFPPSITDHFPSCIWSKNPTTIITNNFANAAIQGIWIDLINKVIGICSTIEGAGSIQPWALPMGAMRGNTVNVVRVCVRIYPFYMPGEGVKPGVLANMNLWKCSSSAIGFRENHGMIITGITMSNFNKGVNLGYSSKIQISNCLFVTAFWQGVRHVPVPDKLPCTQPVLGSDYWYNSGVFVNTEVPISYGKVDGVSITGCYFSGFITSCKAPSSAIGVVGVDPGVVRDSDRMFLASNNIASIGLDSTTPLIYFSNKVSRTYSNPTNTPYSKSIQIMDNSITGRPGAIISEEYFTKMWMIGNVPAPLPYNCARHPKLIQSFFCYGACVRTVLIQWPGKCRPGTVVGELKRLPDGATALLKAYRTKAADTVVIVVNLIAGNYELKRFITSYRAPVITNYDTSQCGKNVNIRVV